MLLNVSAEDTQTHIAARLVVYVMFVPKKEAMPLERQCTKTKYKANTKSQDQKSRPKAKTKSQDAI